MKKSSKAFSLIELSIVIAVIATLIAGMNLSSNLVDKARLSIAQNLTKSSPVSGIKNLMLWYETSLGSSFISTEGLDNTAIGTWYDNNPQKPLRNNATQGTSTYQPKFIENVFGAIPAIRFDGINDYLSYDGTFLIDTNYTIFVVESRTLGGQNYFLSGTNAGTATNLTLGYRSGTQITQSHYNNDINYTIADYSQPITRIHSFWFSKTQGEKYWENGGLSPDKSDSSKTTSLVSYSGSAIAQTRSAPKYYKGDIAEIIMFTQDLKDEERQSIESYLSKKYNVAITW